MLKLPHGPWNEIMSGNWQGKEISYFENPEKNLMTLIYDRKGEKVKGVVMILSKFFFVEGNASSYARALKQNNILIQKNTPSFKGSFFSITTDPTYVKFQPKIMINEVETEFDKLKEATKKARQRTDDFEVKLIDMRFAQPQQIQELLGEPLALPLTVVRKAGPGTSSEVTGGKALLGIDMDNKKVEEILQNFLLTSIIGRNYKQTKRVVLESCVMNGISALVINSRGDYDKVDAPYPEVTDYSKYQLKADPVGMPVRKFKVGSDIFIQLTLLNKKLFGEIVGAGQNKAVELIGNIIETKKPDNLEKIQQELMQVKEKEVAFDARKGIRICKLINSMHPGIFDGKIDPKEIMAPWLKRTGRVGLVPAKGMKKNLIKGLIYCALKSVYEDQKEEYSTNKIKVEIFIDLPETISGKGSQINKEINALVKLCAEYGIGVCVTADDELDVDKEILDNSTTMINCFEENNATITTSTKKAKKIKVRPPLSSL